MSGSGSQQNPAIVQALLQARLTGRAVPIPGAFGLAALPNGSLGTPGGGFGGRGPSTAPQSQPVAQQPVAPSAPFSAAGVQGAPGSPSGPAVTPPAATPSWWQQLTAPNSNVDLGLSAGTPVATLPEVTVTANRPINQANPSFTAGVQGLPGSPSGPVPAGAPTPAQSQPSQTEALAKQAAAYRAAAAQRVAAQRGGGSGLTTDQLNAQSLAAAQAGRNYWNPAMNVQPGGDVVNALTLPPTASTTNALTAQQPWQSAAVQPVTQQPLS